MKTLFDAVSQGKPVSELGARMYIYGMYLVHGGTPQGFEELDEDDIAMMYLAWSATEAHRHNSFFEGLIKIIQKLIGRRG